jgi:hypothetical protein
MRSGYVARERRDDVNWMNLLRLLSYMSDSKMNMNMALPYVLSCFLWVTLGKPENHETKTDHCNKKSWRITCAVVPVPPSKCRRIGLPTKWPSLRVRADSSSFAFISPHVYICIYICCDFFNGVASSYVYTASSGRVASDWWMNGQGCGRKLSFVLKFPRLQNLIKSSRA